jgi:transposase
MPVARAAQQLGLHANLLRKWARDFRSDPAQAFPGHGRLRPEQAEIERLKKELVRVKKVERRFRSARFRLLTMPTLALPASTPTRGSLRRITVAMIASRFATSRA